MPTVSYFNSHARVGRDVMPHVPVAQGSDFNSHARVGRDAATALQSQLLRLYFNSHARVGRDLLSPQNSAAVR